MLSFAVSDIVPSNAFPSKKETPPNGPPAVDATCAVNVITVPAVAELEEAVIPTEVWFALTVTVAGAEVLGENIAAT